MALPKETIANGAPMVCPDCDTAPKMGVYLSGGGYYIGSYCNCGPYSRESGYYPTREAALKDFTSGEYVRR